MKKGASSNYSKQGVDNPPASSERRATSIPEAQYFNPSVPPTNAFYNTNATHMTAPMQFPMNSPQFSLLNQATMHTHPLLLNSSSTGSFAPMYGVSTTETLPTTFYGLPSNSFGYPARMPINSPMPVMNVPMLNNAYPIQPKDTPIPFVSPGTSRLCAPEMHPLSSFPMSPTVHGLSTSSEGASISSQSSYMGPSSSPNLGALNASSKAGKTKGDSACNTKSDMQRAVALLEASCRRKAHDDREKDISLGASSVPSSTENSVRGGNASPSAEDEGSPAEGDDDEFDFEDDGEDVEAIGGEGRQRGLRRKNRLAQRRFRERQRSALNNLLVKTEDQEQFIISLRKEKKEVEELNKTLMERLNQLRNLMP